MINEAIILAGGLGTRLKGVINDIPKPMAPVDGKPFLEYVLRYLNRFPIDKVILAVGYKHEVIESVFGDEFLGMSIEYAIEKEPLGTGGAIANALKLAIGDDVFLLNGDTFFDVNLEALYTHHQLSGSQLTLSLKPMKNFDRYGTVELKGTQIVAFNEKKPVKQGLINGGVYVLNKGMFSNPLLPTKFSFEKDIMEQGVMQFDMQAYFSDGYFIDIGIPEDYERAQKEMANQLR
ncbi:MAG TPA: D-glycero-D-manno-heptose 1-phosphate guanosyltransferase [Marinilabiliales bacterium]|nr:MAG: D-glycero-D-manno-heptose 1-phosphate guanosyltransferase [Bacteroidetes bacterium GWC2_40_13]OFX72243.1 MAG: D-glycero-D-manno-heptose 1-phosphate guanosyltransferase [Bacteroidetes bacterium GWD2_40_43]OFX90510.1 MAG: D-glycero-D-manno-heptose 1-phosphate guanosyltransferase [Bacteroidetes bacterium GWE2_40_63]OFY17245.1 MAG: D-glycero-D-manno-heptose 1-phosphate guanosyltransferase [Bacteroidetes bacterium GWF2_40_13]OFZ26528.1 MAG: D-glycero-D-manno-heptose 1-phosphate guanosyltrans